MATTAHRKRIGPEHWQSFQAWIDGRSDSSWVFRGMGEVSHALLPSIGRSEFYSEARERSLLFAFRRRVSQFADDAQFTDWTISPSPNITAFRPASSIGQRTLWWPPILHRRQRLPRKRSAEGQRHAG